MSQQDTRSIESPTRDDSERQREVERLGPAAAFGILKNPIRIAILETLWENDGEPTPYAELKRQTPVKTDNFHYHLEQLVDHFVRRGHDGYELRYAGEEVVRAIQAGVITHDVSLPPLEIESECPYCAATIEVRFVDERLTARCTDCGGVVHDDGVPRGTIMHYGFPPSGVVGRSPEDLLRAAHVLYDAKVMPMLEGVCPECAATVEHSFVVCDDHELTEDGLCGACDTRFVVWAVSTCELCGYSRQFAPWFKLLTEPAVVAFYHEHSDFDQSIPFSKLTRENAPYVQSITQTVVSTDPLLVRVDIPLDEAALSVVMDDEFEIVSLEQSASG